MSSLPHRPGCNAKLAPVGDISVSPTGEVADDAASQHLPQPRVLLRPHTIQYTGGPTNGVHKMCLGKLKICRLRVFRTPSHQSLHATQQLERMCVCVSTHPGSCATYQLAAYLFRGVHPSLPTPFKGQDA